MSRIAFFSDVHGNLEALECVLQDLRSQPHDRVVCLGDLASYNADQHACMERLVSEEIEWIAGNHDLIAARLLAPLACSADARYSAMRARAALAPRWQSHIHTLPLILCEEDFVAFHASPWRVDEYLTQPAKIMRTAALLRERDMASIAFFGHSHQSRVWTVAGDTPEVSTKTHLQLESGVNYLVNVGTVGEPRGTDRRATYVIYDTQSRYLETRCAEYDFDVARRKSERGGWRRAKHTSITRLTDRLRCKAGKLRHLLRPQSNDDATLTAITARLGRSQHALVNLPAAAS
ncbi:MAG: metallophosphoesterase family protein [Planctomycetia bacterium]|nr:metallophosphoesterase family protein [Planctomycetia bacterium]